jgi:hypothetical protein
MSRGLHTLLAVLWLGIYCTVSCRHQISLPTIPFRTPVQSTKSVVLLFRRELTYMTSLSDLDWLLISELRYVVS